MLRPLLIVLIMFSVTCVHAQDDGAKFTSFAGFKIGEVNLGQIADELGPTDLIEKGDAGEYEALLCYRAPTGLIYFLSGEMGGSDKRLLGFAVSNTSLNKSCSNLPANRAPSELSLAGLRLGISKAEFARVTARPIKWNGSTARVFFESKRSMTREEQRNFSQAVKAANLSGQMQNHFDVLVTVVGKFSGDKLIEFQVWKVETL